MAALHRIDVHHHISPPGYIAELDPKGIMTRETLEWTPQQSIDLMDKGGVQVALTSITTPGLWFGDTVAAQKLTRVCNDYAAKLVSDYPKRFGMFVNLPMPDIDASLKEIAYGLDVLKADGVVFFTSYGDHWLGDPAFDPVFEELNRRKAVIYVHPTSAACCTNVLKGINDSVIEYGTDTTRCIAQMILTGRSSRFSDLRIIWSHGGGTIPFLTMRLVNWANVRKDLKSRLPDGPVAALKKFYYDTAQAAHPYALSSLLKLVSTSQVVFGTDYPFVTAAATAQGLKDFGLGESDLAAIGRGNAAALLPRLRAG